MLPDIGHRADLDRWVRHYVAEARNSSECVDYLASRGFTPDVIGWYGIGWTGDRPLDGHPANRLAIPSLVHLVPDPTHPALGAAVHLSFRAVRQADTGPKYIHVKGDSWPWNPRGIIAAGGRPLHVTEGQLDGLTLAAVHGLPAIGIPGATAFKPSYARAMAGMSRVYVWGDGDEAGARFAETVRKAVQHVTIVNVPEGYDVNRLHVEGILDGMIKDLQ